jgi:iron complex outermembrane recepter protein
MQCTRFKKSLLVSSIAATMWTLPPMVHAANVLEEVVVTARKRQESLQETPVAITAMSGEQLAAQGLTNTADLRAVVPNVDVYTGNGTTGAANIFIRGVGARNTGVNYDSGVGIYLDGVYLSRPDGAVMDNVDIGSLEVLRGPQGTLFGKNTTGGAIIYTTNKPTDKFEGSVDLRAGNFDRRDGKVTVNVPLIEDKLNSRFSVFSTKRDGTVKNVTLDQMQSDEDRFGGQAHFLLLVNDDLTVDFNNFYTKVDQMARGQKCEFVQGLPGAGWQSSLQGILVQASTGGMSIADKCRENEALSIDKVTSDLERNYYFSENYTSAITVDWDINDKLSFKSVTAYRGTRAGEANDLDAMDVPLLTRTNFTSGTSKRTTDQWSQEFQFSGNAFDEKLDYVAGIFGFSEKSGDGASAGITGPFFLNTNLAYYTSNLTQLDADNWSGSVFSQADWKFNETWTLTGGLRYTKESRKLRRVVDYVDVNQLTTDGSLTTDPGISPGIRSWPNGLPSFNPNAGYVHIVDPEGTIEDINDQEQTADNSAWTPMVSLQRTFEDLGFIETGSAYVTAAKGFLSGGLSEAADPGTQAIFDYKPEKVINYELGFKFDALDRRIRVNTALFYLDYKDRQLTSVTIDQNTGRIAGIPINAAKSNIKGIEIESQIIPMDNMLLSANVTFNKGEIKKFDDHRIVTPNSQPAGSACTNIPVGTGSVDYCEVDRSGEPLPRLPKAIYFAALQYTFNTAIGEIIPRAQFSLRTEVDNCFDASSCDSGAYKVNQRDIGARLTWLSPDKAWSVTAYGNNLADQRYIIGGTPLVDGTQTAGTVYNEPRMYGVETHYSW